MKPRPFISYAREDSDIATKLYDDLRELGADPWLDKKELLAGQDWRQAIRKAIRECSHFLALISTNSVSKRGFVQRELREALEILEECPPGQIFVIPIRLDEADTGHDALSRIHRVDLFPSYDEGLTELAKSMALGGRKGVDRVSARRTALIVLAIVGGLLLLPFVRGKVASSRFKGTPETQGTTSSLSLTPLDGSDDEAPLSLRPPSAAISRQAAASGEAAFPTDVPDATAREVVTSTAPTPTTVQKVDESSTRNSAFQVPSRLEPELIDSYWSKELEASILGHGRITPELRKQQLRAAEATTRGDWQEAQALWAETVTMSSCCGDYLNYNLAVARANGGDWSGAIEPLKTACGFGDVDRSGYALGIVYARLGRWSEAAEVLRGVGMYSHYAPRSRSLLKYVEAKLRAQWDADS